MSHDDFEFEPQPGLPAPLPPGEALLWQGSPAGALLARHAYHVRSVAAYCLLLVAVRAGYGIGAHEALGTLLLNCSFLALMGALATGILLTLAYFSAAHTIYSITSRRILIRHGVAVSLTLNLPFTRIAAVNLKSQRGTTGELLVRVFDDTRIGYLINWPYVRAGYLARPQPALRALADAPAVAKVLAQALSTYVGTVSAPTAAAPSPGYVPANAA